MKNLLNLFDDLNWEKATNYPEGTLKKTLRDEESGKTILLKVPKGFKMASHSHIMTEQHFVLDGMYTSDNVICPKGSYQLIRAHGDHGPFESKEGALILVIWDKLN
jgi:anti-sigma factor ChrR (cupin superfamily)